MVYTNLKNTALMLRKQGMSYSEIQERVPASKATLSKWFKEIKLSPLLRSRLKKKRVEGARRGSEKKISETRQKIEEIRKKSSREIGKISPRELWLMGAVLYWKNGNQTDLKKGVHFTSSDPEQIKFFLKWLQEVGGLKKEEIGFDILASVNELGQLADYWSKVTGFPSAYFFHFYRYKKMKAANGLLRIKVKASSMLARQISGWIEGLKEILKI